MRSEAPLLLPILRSRHQAEMLTLMLLRPDEDHTLAELSRSLGVSMSTLHREVQRLLEAEVITAREVGRARLLRVNTANRLVPPLTQLLTISFGPQVIVGEEFRTIGGIDVVLIYGSWAARYHGHHGPPPNDVDVLVIGEPRRSDVYEAAERAGQRLDLPVNPTVASRRRWEERADALIQEIRASPVVPVLEHAGSGQD